MLKGEEERKSEAESAISAIYPFKYNIKRYFSLKHKLIRPKCIKKIT
jgi:hypothetical protein